MANRQIEKIGKQTNGEIKIKVQTLLTFLALYLKGLINETLH